MAPVALWLVSGVPARDAKNIESPAVEFMKLNLA